MIKSDLIKKLAEDNPHLYYRDVEKIVGTIFDDCYSIRKWKQVELRVSEHFQQKIGKPGEETQKLVWCRCR